MVIAFVWVVFFLALGVRQASHPRDVVALAATSTTGLLLADLVADRGKVAKRPMVAFVAVAPWLTFDTRGWWTAIGTAWDHRLHTAHGFANLGGNWDHAVERQWSELWRSVGFAIGIAALSGLSWWLAGKIDWTKRLSILRVTGVFAAATTSVLMILLVVHGRDLPTAEQFQPRRHPAVATVFSVRHGEPPPPEMDRKRSAIDIGEGVTAIRECQPGCHLSLVRPPHASCTLEMPNLRVPVVVRRDAKHDLWFLDDGVDLLAYRGSDLRCIDLSVRDLLLDVKPSPAWSWGGGVGLALALLARILARFHLTERTLVSLEAFAVAILLATMPPVVSTLLGAFVW